MRKIGAILLVTLMTAVFFLAGPWARETFAAEKVPAANRPQLKGTTPVAPGVVLQEYFWETTSGPVKIFVQKIDLANQYIKLAPIPGKGKITERLNVTAMARNTGAVAAVNGDFYTTTAEGSPIGPMVIDGLLAVSPINRSGLFALGITSDQKAYIDAFSFEGQVTAPNNAKFELTGLNKTTFRMNPDNSHSHQNRLHLYNHLWGGATRGQDELSTPTEMLVDENGLVVEIRQGAYFDIPIQQGRHILRGDGLAASFLVDNFQPGDKVEIQYAMTPDRDWSMVIGGHSILVNEGQAVPYTKDLAALEGLRARTAAGISQDRQTLYLVGVEGRTEASKGLKLGDLAKFFEELGAWQALNLDGGGSTTMVARPLGEGEASRVFSPEQANERLVVNAVGVYSSAPQGKLQGLVQVLDQVVLVNERTSFQVKAYDEYYNPLDSRQLPLQWSTADNKGSFDGNIFTGLTPGLTEVRASLNGISTTFSVDVIGKNQIQQLALTTGQDMIELGQEVPLKLTLTTGAGKIKNVPAALVQWEFYNLKGHVSPEGMLTVSEAAAGEPGFVVARYQGYSAPLAIKVNMEEGLTVLDDMAGLAFLGFPETVQGHVSLELAPFSSKMATMLTYDFSQAEGTAAAYLKLGEEGVLIDSNAYQVAFDVYGDNGNQWLRAELADAEGNSHRVDLTTNVNWSGWQTVSLDLTSLPASDSYYLKRIYVVSDETTPGIRTNVAGALFFKDLRVKYRPAYQNGTGGQAYQIELTVGQKEIVVNGEKMEMDVTPVIRGDRTLVPVRFISEALKSAVTWKQETGNATIVQKDKWLDLWLNQEMMVVNGKRVPLDVPPALIDNRMMIPLRFIAEALDLTVGWEQESKKITLTK